MHTLFVYRLYCATVSDGPNQLWLKLCNDKEESVDSDQEVRIIVHFACMVLILWEICVVALMY